MHAEARRAARASEDEVKEAGMADADGAAARGLAAYGCKEGDRDARAPAAAKAPRTAIKTDAEDSEAAAAATSASTATSTLTSTSTSTSTAASQGEELDVAQERMERLTLDQQQQQQQQQRESRTAREESGDARNEEHEEAIGGDIEEQEEEEEEVDGDQEVEGLGSQQQQQRHHQANQQERHGHAARNRGPRANGGRGVNNNNNNNNNNARHKNHGGSKHGASDKRPKAGYTCKICGKPGGEPDSHWFQLCPHLANGTPSAGWPGGSAHRNRQSNAPNHNRRSIASRNNNHESNSNISNSNSFNDNREFSSPAGHVGSFEERKFRSGQSNGGAAHGIQRRNGGFQPPTEGYVCKVCGKPGGERDSHWFQQCPFPNTSNAMIFGGGSGVGIGASGANSASGMYPGVGYSPPMGAQAADFPMSMVQLNPMGAFSGHMYQGAPLYYMNQPNMPTPAQGTAPSHQGSSAEGGDSPSQTPVSAAHGYPQPFMYAPGAFMMPAMQNSMMAGYTYQQQQMQQSLQQPVQDAQNQEAVAKTPTPADGSDLTTVPSLLQPPAGHDENGHHKKIPH